MNITEKQNNENNKINLIEKNIKKTNNKKKHDSPQLSAKTLEIIQKIKDDRKNRFFRLDNNKDKLRYGSSFSDIKYKYEELS